MRKLDLRDELVSKYGSGFDLRKNWCSKLLNSKEMSEAELTLLLFYLRGSFYSNCSDLKKIVQFGKMNRQDAFLLSVIDKSLHGEILIFSSGKYYLLSASKYIDEYGRQYCSDFIISKFLFLAPESQAEHDEIFTRSCRSEKLVREYIRKKQPQMISLIVNLDQPDYYVISSGLLQTGRNQIGVKVAIG